MMILIKYLKRMKLVNEFNAKDVADFLNNLLKLDRTAITEMFIGTKIECNSDLGDHKTITTSYSEYGHRVTPLAVLNGLLRMGNDTDQWLITANYDIDEGVIETFKLTNSKNTHIV